MYLSLLYDSMYHDNISGKLENMFCSKKYCSILYYNLYIRMFFYVSLCIVNKSIIFKLHHQLFLLI